MSSASQAKRPPVGAAALSVPARSNSAFTLSGPDDHHHPRLPAERYFRSIVTALDTGIVVLDADCRIEWLNPAAAGILGAGADLLASRLTARRDTGCVYDTDDACIPAEQRPIARTRRTGSAISNCVIGVDLNEGQRVWLSLNCRLLEPDNLLRSALLLSFTDVTAERLASRRLDHEARHDALTGLPNRADILARMSRTLASGSAGALAAVLFIDLDNLKVINDSFGHHAGDAALRVAAQRLRGAVRTDDVIARLGGDEFVALLVGPITDLALDHLSERLHARLAEPVSVAGVSVRLSASIGITSVEHNDHRDAAHILRDADLAMYHVKATGRGGSHRFTACLRDANGQSADAQMTNPAGAGSGQACGQPSAAGGERR